MEAVTGEKSQPEGISIRAYARHRGTSAPSVIRAIKSRRIEKCLVFDARGKARIVDVALADAEWSRNTDLSKAPGYVRLRAAGRTATTPPKRQPPAAPAAPTTDDAPDATAEERKPGTLSLLDASALEKEWKARLAELDYNKKAGELVSAKEVETRLADEYSRCRTKLLGIPRKAKAAAPDLTHAHLAVLDQLIREALEELASSGSTDGAA